MADTYGNLYFSWVQCSLRCIPDSTKISAWQIAIGQNQVRKTSFVFLRVLCGKCSLVFSAFPCLRGEQVQEVRL